MSIECQIRKGDIGTTFLVTIEDTNGIVNVSTATTKQIILQKPDGSVLTKTAQFTSDGSDGKIQYATISGDLDQEGQWKLQGYVIMPAGSWKTNITTFRVYGNLS